MSQNLLEGVKKVHFIGIGGSGMFPIVQILKNKGLEITGSDNNESDIVRLARDLGIEVSMTQTKHNIKDQDLIIYTSAILEDNEELLAAQKSGIKLLERNDILGFLTRQHEDCICVCGTHGKTTTTAMITQILVDSGKNPAAVIGGKLLSIGGYSVDSESSVMVCEACEFKDHFLKLSPKIAVVLNIDNDHMEYFRTMENAKNSYKNFCLKTKSTIIYCGDDESVVGVIESFKTCGKELISFGFGEQNDYYVKNLRKISNLKTRFSIYSNGTLVGDDFEINVVGRHNVLNALASFVASQKVFASLEDVKKGLKNFFGVGRRFELIGKVNGITVVDDYAHHPSEVAATLKAAKECGFKKIWAIHQPFTFSRTKALLSEFAEALSLADEVVLTEILGSRETNVYSISSEDLARKIKGCKCFKTQEEAAKFVLENASSGDLAITLGCGDIYKAAKIMVFGKY